jgi:hypothetical protein
MGAMDNRRDSFCVVGLGALDIAGALYWNTVVFQLFVIVPDTCMA